MEPVAAATTGRIVGIGASAGGLESLEQLFSTLPANTGLAFIVVQHLSPDFRSLMDELIGRHSEMPVVVAQDGMTVRENHIYLMPPRKEMIIRERQLVLTDKEPHFTLPIDTFFRSLAQDVGDQAVAVVLSGSGSDGSRGIVDVKQAGGLVLAETVATAKFDGMPSSAAATGVVDQILAPQDLARVLQGLPPLRITAEQEPLSEDPAMDAVLRMLRDQFGIDFSLYKMTTVGRRIQRRVDLLRFSSLAEYVERLRAEPGELDVLYQDLLIGVTQFFRDPGAFEVLENDILPKLIDAVPDKEEIRVWVAGCATGEEAYSIAMLLWELLAARKRTVHLKILATDVHQQSIEIASAGVYGEEQLAHVSPQRLQRFFTRRSSGYQISQDLRSLIVFAKHNVTKDAPFTKMNLITCRNMLIYLQPHAQRTVLSLFHFGLASGGVLFLGASETPGPISDEFTVLEEHWKIYRKRRDVQLLSSVRLPMRQPQRRPAILDLPRTSTPDPLMLQTYDQLLDRFMPPGFLLDENRVLLDSFANAEKLLTVRRRRPSSNLLDLVDDELRSILAGAIQRATKDRARIAYSGVRIPVDGAVLRCTVAVDPLVHPRTGVKHILVSFLDIVGGELGRRAPAVEEATPVPPPIPVSEASRERMDTLETELAYTRETLQATIEELETSNEEMQATNEELVASNEELQSTNEELHSVNEELYTVNAEYQQKIMELKELNTDMQHLLEGTDVGTVFLDRELRIRRFTSRIAGVFRFQSGDVGRTISDFSHNIERPDLMEEIESVRREGVTVEDEVRDRAGTPYFLRILPYRVKENASRSPGSIDGVVITLTDMSALDKARQRLAQLSAIVESSEDAIVGKQLDGTITSWNRGAQQMYGYTADEVVGKNVRMLMAPGSENELHDAVERIQRGERVEHQQSLRIAKSGRQLDVSVTLSPIYDAHGTLCGVSAISRDISTMLVAQRELEQRQKRISTLLEQTEEVARRREQFLAMLSHELRNPLAAVINAAAVLGTPQGPSRIVECKNVVERQATHMKRLLDDLLDVSRITRGKFELRTEDTDLRRPVEAALESVAPLFAQRDVMIVTEITEKPLPIHGDVNRLMQVVVNLLSNAANYSPRNSRVKLLVDVENGAAVLRVIDHGVGIELELQERIFDLFVQSEQRLDRSRGGLGVGLSLAKNIVELHGGRIEVNSDGPGKGADFKVTIPLTPMAKMHTTPAAPLRKQRCRIVVVDDQDDSREMLKMLLESRDHDVTDAADGPSALELIARERPDVAFIDIGLPVMTGYEIAQRIRAQKDLDDVHLVALTGYGAPSDVSAARAAGFDEHVIKPADLARIEAILARDRTTS